LVIRRTATDSARYRCARDRFGGFCCAEAFVALKQATELPDVRQAVYFLKVLDRHNIELADQLSAQRSELATYVRKGDLSGVRHKQRIIKALVAERRTIEKLMATLKVRLASRS
jgi:hypothetical protein